MLMGDNSLFVPVDNPNMSPERTKNARVSMEERLSTFVEVEKVYTEKEAIVEASRCLKCPTHWCEKACPAGVPVTDFIEQIRLGDYDKAYEMIHSASTLPEICSRVCPQEKQCQMNCTRGIRTQAVGIGRLERFVVEKHYENKTDINKSKKTGKTVAVVGSGPSGLSAAQILADAGYGVTVYEASDKVGGIMQYGIPNMKIDKATLERKQTAMEKEGVVFKVSTKIGSDVAMDELEKSYDAIILSAGTGEARTLGLEKELETNDVYLAIDFLSSTTRSLVEKKPGDCITAEGKDVVIIGGGDTGSDCVGTSIRHGAKSIKQIELLPKNAARQIIYDPYVTKSAEKKFDASQEECLVKFCEDPHIYETTVKSVNRDSQGNLESLTIVHMQQQYKDGNLHMTEETGTERTIPCQLLIIAAGFKGVDESLAKAVGVDLNQNRITTDHYTTNKPQIFACGDCRMGQSLVVKAMVDGRECAHAVMAFLEK